jgi:hypothetical protein
MVEANEPLLALWNERRPIFDGIVLTASYNTDRRKSPPTQANYAPATDSMDKRDSSLIRTVAFDLSVYLVDHMPGFAHRSTPLSTSLVGGKRAYEGSLTALCFKRYCLDDHRPISGG